MSEDQQQQSNNNATAVDHAVLLNNWLQGHPTGNVSSDLKWIMTQEGPNNQAVHHAVATFRGIAVGNGQGVAKGPAKRAAAEQALIYFNQNPLPPRQA